MKNSRKLDNSGAKWVDEAMQSLDGIQRVPANPFLYTRILARIENKMGMWEKAAGLLSKPVFALASIVLFLTINMAVILWGQQKAESNIAQKLTSEQMLASEFINTQNYQLVDINE